MDIKRSRNLIQTALAIFVVGMSATPVAASLNYQEPPWIRTGKDVIDMCNTASIETAGECEGMIDTLADQTEAARWRDNCGPIVFVPPLGGASMPPWVIRSLAAAKEHPDWLDLPAAEFVDRVERGERCHRR